MANLGWVDLDLGSSPGCSYLLPRQDGGTSQIQVKKNPAHLSIWHALYVCENANVIGASTVEQNVQLQLHLRLACNSRNFTNIPPQTFVET